MEREPIKLDKDVFKESTIWLANVYGIDEPIQLTEEQGNRIIEAQADPDKAKSVRALVGNYYFKASSVMSMKKVKRRHYDLASYCRTKIEQKGNDTKLIEAR